MIVTPFSFRLINTLYRDIYPSLEASPGLLALARVGLAVLALAPATILMGATLPTLTRQFAGDVSLAGAFSRFYAANTIGAIVGTVVAGFVLIELLGLSGALAVGAACSAVAGLAALTLARGVRAPATAAAQTTTAPSTATPIDHDRPIDPAPHRPRLPRRRPPGPPRVRAQPARSPPSPSGSPSSRASHRSDTRWPGRGCSPRGPATRRTCSRRSSRCSWRGLAIGAVLFAVLRTRLGDPMRLLAVSQIVAAVLATLGLVFVLVAAEPPTPNKWQESLETLFRSSFIVVLPVTIALGVAFPASSALLPDEAAHAGEGSGRLLAVNTIGSIAGSLLVPFVLIPLVGSPVLVAGLAAVNASVGLLLGWRMSRRPSTSADADATAPEARAKPGAQRPPHRGRRRHRPRGHRRDRCSARGPRPARRRLHRHRSAASSSNRPRTRSPRSRPARSWPPPSCGSRAPR